MIYSSILKTEELKNEARVNEWINELQQKLALNTGFSNSGHLCAVAVVKDNERGLFLPRLSMTVHGVLDHYLLNQDFFASGEYQAIIALGSILKGLIEDGAFVKRGDKQQPIDSFKQALAWLMNEAKRGYGIQRYKGLGEMNPDQLWETTMDPQSRRMLKVTIEDAIGADQIFTTLMGDQVEPRRAFIETNALNVANLDI
jgi:DNA gyrase subunit B